MLSLTKRNVFNRIVCPSATALGSMVLNVKGDAQLLFHVPFHLSMLGETARAVSVT
jgi:hypothetical protein